MGKNKCCKKSSTSMCNDSSSSSSCTSSSTYGYCCTKYPKCYCIKNKCAPIYYPNNCVGNYPCNPCPPPCPAPCPQPCPPYPCPPYPCPPTQCGLKYTANTSIITSNTTLNVNSQNVYICNPTSAITITLPPISSLSSCGGTKMFVISNISTENITISTSGDSLTNSSKSTLSPNDTITLYSVNIPGGAYWVVA